MKKLWKNLVVATITIGIMLATLLVTSYGAIIFFWLFGPWGAVAWLLSVAVIVLTLAGAFMEDACSKADEWISR